MAATLRRMAQRRQMEAPTVDRCREISTSRVCSELREEFMLPNDIDFSSLSSNVLIHPKISGIRVLFPDLRNLLLFHVGYSPSAGFWAGGTFIFSVSVPLVYNLKPPEVVYLGPNRIWHPNIDGSEHPPDPLAVPCRLSPLENTVAQPCQPWRVCLDFVMEGVWQPKEHSLKHLLIGLAALFHQPNPHDRLPGPTCERAAEMLIYDPTAFEKRAALWMNGFYEQ